MVDAEYALKTAYWQFLQDLTYEGVAVEVYEGIIPGDATAPYVLIGPWMGRASNTKHSQGQDGEFMIQVIDRKHEAEYNEDSVNLIARQITTRLKPSVGAEPLVIEGYSHWSKIDTVRGLSQPNNVDVVFRKIITVYHSLREL